MKKLLFVFTLTLGGLFIQQASAQFRINLQANIGSQPVWGPTGYDHVEYYYLPDIDVYYYVPNHQYIYMDRGQWRFSNALPSRYSNYDFYNSYKVVINDRKPYLNSAQYREKYSQYRGNHDQQVIRNSHENKYFQNKDHPEHNNWRDDQDNKNPRDHRNRGNRRY